MNIWYAGMLPTDTSLSSNLKFWVDATDQSTLFQDSAGSSPVTANGQKVNSWNDKSGNGYHITQNGMGNPTYESSAINSLAGVYFNIANNDYYLRNTSLLTSSNFSTQQGTVFTVYRNDTFPTNNHFALTTIGSSVASVDLYLTTSFNGDFRNARIESANYSYPQTGTHIKSVTTSSGNGWKLYADGSLKGSASHSWGINTTFAIGAELNHGSSSFVGYISEVIIFNTGLTDTQRKNIEAYLQGKYAVSAGYATLTRDTSTTYNSSAGSAKLVTGSNTTAFNQSVNVGDTNTYNLVSYARTDGSAVTSSDVELFYNGSTISTTYTSVGSGWYKLTGTLTGANASRLYGVQVKANKTVYVDNFSLNNYASSGTLTSSIFDTEFSAGAAWGTLTYTSSGSTVAVKVRTSNSSSMAGATDFSSCSAVTSGNDISSNSCVTDSHRYIQYQLSLSTSDTSSTPTFSDVSIAFATYDADAPSISLTALTPDPNSDNTPTLSGTATESVGTVSNVQFQMDSTSGSWTACTADDGAFDEASETFTCTPSALSDGSHTMYVRATDSNSNTTSNASASTDTFIIDVTAPASFDLDSPGHESYTTNQRPTFKWKATTDATSGLSSYSLEVDNGDSGDFSITGIPTSRTTDYDTSKYLVHYENFSDSDSTNNYISIYTKSSSSWGSGENDGKLKEGSRTWTIKAIDAAGNERSEGRTVIVDLTGPTLSSLSSSDSAGSKDGYQLVTNQKPSLTGTITDNYSPDKVEISIYKENYFLGAITSKELFTTLTYSLSNGANSKSLSFSIPVPDSLDYGSYEVNIKGQDKAGNKSGISTIYFKVLTARQTKELLQGKISKEEKKTIQDNAQVPLPRLEEKARERREKEAQEFEKVITPFSQTFSVIPDLIGNLYKSSTAWIPAFAGMTKEVAGMARDAAGRAGRTIAVAVKEVNVAMDRSSDNIQKEIVSTYKSMPSMVSINQILRPAADTAIAARKEVGRRLENGGQMLAQISNNTLIAVRNTSIASEENTKRAINKFYSESSKVLAGGISKLAFGVGERADIVSNRLSVAIVNFGYLFATEPTRIYDVSVADLSPTSVKVSWRTNHPANGKINYGLDESYPLDAQTSKRTTYHEFTLTNLTSNTEYHFEVMSQNKNYVYDANRKFTTPKQ